jgi:Fe-S cluster biogenesis protein NfuA
LLNPTRTTTVYEAKVRECTEGTQFVRFVVKKPRRLYMEEQVKAALENVRPSLQADGGDVEFVSVDNEGTVSVKLTGACGCCPMSQMTLKMGIENYLKKEIPQVKAVVGI